MPQNGESWTSKIVLALVSASLGVVGSLLVFHWTAREPHLTVTITAPTLDFGKNKVTQFLTIRNDGSDLAKSVRIGLKGVQGRLYDEEFLVTFDPARPDLLPVPSCDPSGDCVLRIGDLQPSAYSTIRLRYRRPPLNDTDIDTFSDNASSIKKKVASTELIQ